MNDSHEWVKPMLFSDLISASVSTLQLDFLVIITCCRKTVSPGVGSSGRGLGFLRPALVWSRHSCSENDGASTKNTRQNGVAAQYRASQAPIGAMQNQRKTKDAFLLRRWHFLGYVLNTLFTFA